MAPHEMNKFYQFKDIVLSQRKKIDLLFKAVLAINFMNLLYLL
jgi:hypothetical protein